jgi:hypothetical protein
MRKWIYAALVVVPLTAAAGLVYANTHGKANAPQQTSGYICPITGEELPCPNCCPLNRGK